MPLDLYQLGAECLIRLDRGAASRCLDTAISRAAKDCVDRPGDKRARKVVMQLEFIPITEINGDMISTEGAQGSYKVKFTAPAWESGTLDFGVRTKAGGEAMFIFSENSPASHRQALLFDDSETIIEESEDGDGTPS